jgi:hypothetical protein
MTITTQLPAATELDRAGPPGYVAITGFVVPCPRLDEAVAELRAVIRSATGGRDDVRLRAAVPSLHRAAAQGRTAHGAIPAARGRAGTRRPRPRDGLLVPDADRRPGHWRPRHPPRAPTPSPAAEARGLSRVGGPGADRADRGPTSGELRTMQVDFVELGRMGGDMGPPDPADVRPRGSGVRPPHRCSRGRCRGRELAQGWGADSGEGRWALESRIYHDVPTQPLARALFARFGSRDNGEYAARLPAALGKHLGRHPVLTGRRS